MTARILQNLTELAASPSGRKIVEDYLSLLEAIDRRFAELVEDNPTICACEPGCTDCCLGVFEVSILDALLILSALDREERQERFDDTLSEAVRFSEKIDAAGWPFPHFLHRLAPDGFSPPDASFDLIPCPFLNSKDHCRIYSRRPSICRFQGIPLFDPISGLRLEDECPRMPDKREAQNFDLQGFDQRELALYGELCTVIPELSQAEMDHWDTPIASAVLWSAMT